MESGRKRDRPQLASARTKAALAAAKARGVKLGNPNLRAGSPAQARAANALKTARARARRADVLPLVEQARRGAVTLQELADALAARGVLTPAGGGARWCPTQVARVLGRYPKADGTSAKAPVAAADGAEARVRAAEGGSREPSGKPRRSGRGSRRPSGRCRRT